MAKPQTKTGNKTKTNQILLPPPKLDLGQLERALGFIEAKWSELEHYCPTDTDTLLGVPYPYFTPGSKPREGFVHHEMYYWDTYFICQGLIGTKREHQAYEQADNLLHLLRRFGMVPAANRIYMTGRSQPPFLSTLLLELYELGASKEWLAPRMELVKKEYRDVWMGTLQPHWRLVFDGLSRNYEVNVIDELVECESGWDFNTRFYGQASDYLPVDLNALLYKYEADFERAALILGKPKEALQWQQRADARKQKVDEYMWNSQAGFYFDYNYKTGQQSRVWSLAGYYPLWAGMASEEQAEALAANLDKFEAVGGLTTTLEYPVVSEHQDAQWSYPNGWAPLHLLTVRGLANYGYIELANRITRRWLHTNLHRFKQDSHFFEKYNVVDIEAEPKDGVYPNQIGFGWTNAVFTALARDYENAAK